MSTGVALRWRLSTSRAATILRGCNVNLILDEVEEVVDAPTFDRTPSEVAGLGCEVSKECDRLEGIDDPFSDRKGGTAVDPTDLDFGFEYEPSLRNGSSDIFLETTRSVPEKWSRHKNY